MSYSASHNSDLICGLCPHACRIASGNLGTCRVRENKGGSLSLPLYGKLSALAVDPIEKKPLYHFFPGNAIFSVGFYGCNFHCPFCQNYTISQEIRKNVRTVLPAECVDLALQHKSFGIAYTYSEPLVHFEYVLDTARIAREKGLRNVLVTNGYLNQKPLKELLPYIDAANVDLKSFSDSFYRDELGGSLKPVMRFIETAAESIHLEVTTLVIPGKNDSDDEISSLARFLSSVNRGIPYHLSAYYPTYKYTLQATKAETIFHLAELSSEFLDYVYPGNIPGGSDTRCPACGAELISRRGYYTRVTGLKKGGCSSCGEEIYGMFA
ncbi:MAG: AmmeMemoRadiSam system radical SAM enzyme [Spirochaetales bacterium]|nr:AmmeMemoRadiSam system radical SAM enzyme [Spirochaetales bacterium]